MANIDISYYWVDEDDVVVANIFVDGDKVEQLLETNIGDIEEGEQLQFEEFKKIKKIKKHKINLEEVDSSEVDYSDDADFLYAMGGHGCESFDEYIDKCNFPEEYQ